MSIVMLAEHKAKEKIIDLFVGKKLRAARGMMQLSQRELGEAVGLTFQQIQKFEAGDIRIGAGRLKQLAEALEVPIQYFFDGVETQYQLSVSPGAEESAEKKLARCNCIDLIHQANDDDIKIVHELLQRFTVIHK